MAERHGPCLLIKKKIQAFQTKMLRKLLNISYLGHKKTNDWLQGKIKMLVGTQDFLVMATVRRRKLA